MENCKNNNQPTTTLQQQLKHQHGASVSTVKINSNSNCATPVLSEQPRGSFFEYTTPIADASTDNDDISSNKSTPYYTPLEFIHGTFEFPSPTKLEHMEDIVELHCSSPPASEQTEIVLQRKTPTPTHVATSRSLAGARQQLSSSTSPVVSRKLRRFSLYERRSCSPQQLLIKNAVSTSMDSSTECVAAMADKENAKPLYRSGMAMTERRDPHLRSNSGNSSPIALLETDAVSPKILDINTAGGSSSSTRLPCSPKLLASLNNLNLTGSPLGVISSAGYKNGNYFKFPEIDQVVHDQSGPDPPTEDASPCVCDNQQTRNSRQRNNGSSKERQKSVPPNSNSNTCLNRNCQESRNDPSTTSTSTKPGAMHTTAADGKKNRKNKNNLTIKITDVPCNIMGPSAIVPTSPSPSSKPKTPTIKSTKEKALSLDSAAKESELTIIVSSGSRSNSHASCDEIDAQTFRRGYLPLQQFMPRSVSGARFERVTGDRSLRIPSAAASNRSTSLSQLALLGDGMLTTHGHLQTQSLCPSSTTSSLKTPLSGSSFPRTPRRRIPGGSSASSNASTEWLAVYHRNRNSADAYATTGGESELSEHPQVDADTVIVLPEGTDNGGRTGNNNALLTAPYAPGTATLALTPHRGIHKHNAMLHASNTNLKTLPEFLTLVEFSTTTNASSAHQPHKQKSMELPSATMRPKPISSASSTNLLQRRGSNHSLTLNLHGSCSNLLGNCRSGLSVSNYSLGPAVTNSTTNLNSKSSCNIDLSGAPIITQPHAHATPTQGAKQSLFRRRGSNQSLTLTSLTAASCGNLNSYASQHSLNKVTRTSSFITQTQNTTSNATTKRGLLERRGSNQSLTLNMGSSFGGIGTERQVHASSSLFLGDTCVEESDMSGLHSKPSCCAPPTPHRRFFSSESLNRGSTPFADLNQAHRRNAKQVCFGSVSDLKPSASMLLDCAVNGGGGAGTGSQQPLGEVRRDSFNFQDSTVCSCTGVRNIMTRPLSPQSTSEEFKIYLANIQMLQNASNALNQLDLIKLNYIFDNTYASHNKGLAEQAVPMLSVRANKEAETPPGTSVTTSEDCEVAERYFAAVQSVLTTVQPDDDEQKRIFCDLHKEFWDLPLNHQEKPMVFGSQAKNRYKTILPNENSRVLLEKEGKQLAELAEDIREEHADLAEHISRQLHISDEVPYINANYIKGPDYTSKCYMATQGPLPNTIFEFWLMVYQNTRRYFQTTDNKAGTIQYYQKVIMLTNFAENNRQKCAVYFPIELNEIFITTSWYEVVTPTAAAADFFNAYLLPNESTPPPLNLADGGTEPELHIGIEYYQAEVSEELQTCLPSTRGNYFVIKNIGIVRKNGFSIRKLVILYCINIGANTKESSAGNRNTILLINRLYCFHYWYPDWPDHRSPRDINTLLDICLHILNLGKCESEFDSFEIDDDDDDVISVLQPQTTHNSHIAAQRVDLYQQDIFNAMQPLPIIHCSAGIGRTGCLTAILNAVRQLRQSFAYSLTTMAAEARKTQESSAGTGGELAAQTLLSPVDFALPTRFVTEAQRAIRTPNGVIDTESSFTRNTLYYINYILRHRQQQQSGDDEHKDNHELDEVTAAAESLPWPLPTINDLPKIPDIFVDVLGIVCNLRLQRGGMVQNSEQYELIHRAICLYLKRTFALKRF
uniref:Tyrosine-protein phosphatase non-receptor type 7 n=1 Tax=Bactrocera latifrons TaxID=174628 RepID=A0A0K8UIS8_BACLA